MTDPGGRGRGGWPAYVEQMPAAAMEAMPRPLHTAVARFIRALAIEAGAAIDAGKEPPGSSVGAHDHRYLIHIPGEPIVIEYTVHRDLRELRIPVLVWIH
ncbi:hypothetical protein [Actinacidiphila acididurans]|nr:hypothetical protein [Actinacidiphila acididurans]